MTHLSNKEIFCNALDAELEKISGRPLANPAGSVCKAVASALVKVYCNLPPRKIDGGRAAYFSAEFLPGSFLTSGLAALDLANECDRQLKAKGFDFELLSDPRDPALGNGGLGRLAACLLESAAATDIPLDGYGIRYRYGIFKQDIKSFEQQESPDLWQDDCFFEKQRREDAVKIHFGDGDILAVPYDVPIVSKNTVNRLRLWSAEPVDSVDLKAFLEGDVCAAFKKFNEAESVSGFLYPPDHTDQGKTLRLKQQYFFTAASIDSILKEYKKTGRNITQLPEFIKIQLNDTHPAVAIPELIRRLVEDYSLTFEKSFDLVKEIFSYTNHTVMAEALESWDVNLFSKVLPKVYPYIIMLNNHMRHIINDPALCQQLSIVKDGRIKMAEMSVFTSHKVNGVAQIHTDIIKDSVFENWHRLYPHRIINITNGISHRRWLCLANFGLSAFADQRLGTDWRDDLSLLEQIKNYSSKADLEELIKIKNNNKIALSNYLKGYMSVDLDPQFLFSMQIKRIHEYKRQLLNILGVLGLYIDLKNGELKDFHPTAFIFAGKAAAGYYNAKQIIKLINAVSTLIEGDVTARKYFKIIFVPDYSVKNAMKLIPAADLSEQLSTAGTEASGTGNMKLALNGAPTIGTLDGANIEIVNHASAENNYIFGADKDEIDALDCYDPMDIYYTNDRISRVVDLLKDGPFGNFESLFRSLLFGGYDPADKYKVLLDYPSYFKTRLKANEDYKSREDYAKKCLYNISAAAHFSSDRAVKEYNQKIWQL